MIILKAAAEIDQMRVAGSIVALVLERLGQSVRPGLPLIELEREAQALTEQYRARPAFKGYNGFPAAVCVSVNEEVVHGIPGPRSLKNGDIVGLDFGAVYHDFYADAAITVPVGQISAEAERLIRVTKTALELGIAEARPGRRLFDISAAIQRQVEKNGFAVVRDFVGHGIGRAMHEDPAVPNFVGRDFNPKLKPGMTLAIEPMVNAGSSAVEVDRIDNWTVRTADRRYSAHFEHTVAVTEGEPEILTRLRPELLAEVG